MNFDSSDTAIPIVDLPDAERRAPGRLHVEREGRRTELPLAAVSVSARVARSVASVTVSQTYQNPYTEPLEAVYIFPLAGGAAVRDFALRVGDRTIHGAVKERAAARRDYAEAIEKGHRAALLEQERDDVFTVQVGNLPPGEEVTVEITYSELLDAMDDGCYALRLPMVVAPRYIPGQALSGSYAGDGVEPDTDVVGDASRITPPRLAPGFDPAVSLAVAVELAAAGAQLSDIACTQHATRTDIGNGTVRVALARSDERLDRDFVLRWHETVVGDIGASYVTGVSSSGESYGMVTLDAPSVERAPAPRDVLFVLDRSGSMGEDKMASASRACAMLVDTLEPADRFAILAFDTEIEWFENPRAAARLGRFAHADTANRERGARYLRGIASRGGTEIDMALNAALAELAARTDTAGGRDAIVILLTDGQVGDESRVLKSIQTRLGSTRVFTIGIDTAVNDGFLKRLAKLGGGTATFVEPGAMLDDALRAIAREIGRPAVTELRIVAADDAELRTAPARIPDLFVGRRATVFVATASAAPVRVLGRLDGVGTFDVTLAPTRVDLPAIAHLWARTRVTDLEDAYRIEPARQAELKQQIVEVSVRHRVLSRFTAFVVVDEQEVVVTDGSLRHVVQPVEMPAVWGATGVMYSLSARHTPLGRSRRSSIMASAHDDTGQLGMSDMAPVDDNTNILYQMAYTRPSTKSVEDWLRDIRTQVDAIRANLAQNATALVLSRAQLLERALDGLRSVMPRGDKRLKRIAKAVKQLVKVLKKGKDPAAALREFDEALADTRNFWETSI